MEPPVQNQSFFELLHAAGNQLKTMLKIDTRLLRAEMEQKGSDALSIGLWLVIAVFCMLLALAAALEGLIFVFMAFGFRSFVAAFIVTAIFALAGLGCGLAARSRLRQLSVMPDKTIAAFKDDVTAFRKAIADGVP